MAKNQQHAFDEQALKLHVKVGGSYGGGACLTRHEGRAENSCSHIWQAQHRAETTDRAMYAWPKYRSIAGVGRSSTHFSIFRKSTQDAIKKGADEFAERKQRRPNPGDWDPGRGRNFLHYMVPYWHNSHHIIPNGVLNGTIQKVAEDNDWRLFTIIRWDLLDAKYNLNHFHNMIILPMDEAVAKALGLPRHLSGADSGKPTRGEAAQYFSHSAYSNRVRTLVRGVIDQYADALDSATGPHPDFPAGKDIRSQLEDVSATVRATIVAFGAVGNGMPVDMMSIPGTCPVMIYELDPLGDGADGSLCVLHDPPRDMGPAGVRPSRGRPVGDDAPMELRIEMSDLSPGTALGSLVGNTVGYLIADEALAEALTAGVPGEAMEVLPVTIVNHRGRVASTAYRVVNPLGSLDAVDLLASDVLWADGEVGGRALRIREPVVDPAKVEGVPGVFRLAGLPGRYFLTAATARSLQGRGFTNVLLSEVQTVPA